MSLIHKNIKHHKKWMKWFGKNEITITIWNNYLYAENNYFKN